MAKKKPLQPYSNLANRRLDRQLEVLIGFNLDSVKGKRFEPGQIVNAEDIPDEDLAVLLASDPPVLMPVPVYVEVEDGSG